MFKKIKNKIKNYLINYTLNHLEMDVNNPIDIHRVMVYIEDEIDLVTMNKMFNLGLHTSHIGNVFVFGTQNIIPPSNVPIQARTHELIELDELINEMVSTSTNFYN